VARNAWYALALLALAAVMGCAGEAAGAAEAKAAADGQAQIAKIHARVDSLRQARDRNIASANAAPADTTAQASLAATPAATPRPAHPGADSLKQDAETAVPDSVQRSREIEVMRETFAYAGGTRDPFASLIDLNSTGPEIADLDLVGVYLDLRTPSNNVVVLREKASLKRHKMRVGDQLGRARLVQIRPRDAVFVIQDFGFERQDTLSLRKQEVETP
jgi:hypothetical protein